MNKNYIVIEKKQMNLGFLYTRRPFKDKKLQFIINEKSYTWEDLCMDNPIALHSKTPEIIEVLKLDNPECEVRMLEEDMLAQGYQTAIVSSFREIEELGIGDPIHIISNLIQNGLRMKLTNFIYTLSEDYTDSIVFELVELIEKNFNVKFNKQNRKLEVTWKVTEVK